MGYQVGSLGGDLVVDILAGLFGVRVDAVQQADAHGHRADVQVVLGEHLDGLKNITGVKHTHSSVVLLCSVRWCAWRQKLPAGSH